MHSDRPAPLVQTVSNTDTTRIGERYRVQAVLGRGGMAIVYRVQDANSGRDLALKQLTVHNDAAHGRESKALFEREFYTLAQLSHPSVIEVYDYGIASAGPYYTMELLDGGDLSTLAPLDLQSACDVMMQVCSSLSLLHSRRLLHRDISPRNIRCTPTGLAKLIDFGALIPMGAGGTCVGTPAFIAPEVLHHRPLDARADLFSLGATLYFTLTGRPPFAARVFGELREAWSQEPTPPSQLTAGIPPALDTLLSSLLSIDPARRPRSAFEVTQRLAAIAGRSVTESAQVQEAYLSAPTLIGRESSQRRLLQHVQRAVQGQGGAIAIEGEAGSGRSSLLDACVLDAKTLGATVLKVAGRSATALPFEAAHVIATQLLESLPDAAVRCARAAAVYELFVSPAHDTGARMVPLAQLASAKRAVLQAAFASWLQRVCLEYPLLIAVDDSDRVDEASLALLAGLALSATTGKLAIAICVQTPVSPAAPRALTVLHKQCSHIALSAFTQTQSLRFVQALFGDVPHFGLVGDRIHQIAAGNPRASMSLAQHMLDHGLIRYVDGHWLLPPELALSDLPATAEAALRGRLASLPALALRLAQTQALALDATFSRADYAELATKAEQASLDEALNVLLRQTVLVSDGVTYALAHHSMRMCLVSLLTAAEIARYHAVLAQVSMARAGQLGLSTVYHWLHAGLVDAALDGVTTLIDKVSDVSDFIEASTMQERDIANTLAQAFELAEKHGRPARLSHELARHLVALSVVVDSELHARYAPALLSQLERDTGLLDYRASDPALPKQERVQLALTQALARFSATPEHARVYRVDEAIKFLAICASVGIVIGVRARDSRLLESLPGYLEPFADLSPVLYALWQNLISATEMNYRAQPLKAHARALDVYERLGLCVRDELRYVDRFRYAVCFAIGVMELSLGYGSADVWIDRLDDDSMQRVNAMRLRRIQSVFAGDSESAERYRLQAEVLSVQASARQMFDAPVFLEVEALRQARDLTGIKHVADAAGLRAAREPHWRGMALLAQAEYQRLRGDFVAALEAFEQSIACDHPRRQDRPAWLDTWRLACAGKIAMLVELGRAAEAREFGVVALALALEVGIDAWSHDIVRELALAEAKLGDLAGATQRLEALIAARAHILPAYLATDYEARACIAIWAKDAAGAAYFGSRAVQSDDAARSNHLLSVRQSRLIDEARAVGLDFAALPSGFESAILGQVTRPARRSALTAVTAALQQCASPTVRVHRALELLGDSAGMRAGLLYLYRDGALKEAAARDAAADSALDGFVRERWRQQLQDSATAYLTQASGTAAELEALTWTSPSRVKYRLISLRHIAKHEVQYLGFVALVDDDARALPAVYWETASAIALRLLERGDAEGVSAD